MSDTPDTPATIPEAHNVFAREAGAEILTNALNRPTVKLTQSPALTREDIDELNDL